MRETCSVQQLAPDWKFFTFSASAQVWDIAMEPVTKVLRRLVKRFSGEASPEVEVIARGAALEALKLFFARLTEKTRLPALDPCSGQIPRSCTPELS